ncbi:MAG: tetratricopeptide (TPR) repeat protein [Parasphingorhabdus sp.]|jgi:tetratricopeptide (TPR) repeat protein
MALWEHSPALLSGYCALFKGNYEESVILLEQVMSAFDELNFCLWKPVNHFHLAEAYLGLEDHQQALESVQQGLVDVGIQNEHWYEPELYRMQGRILEAQSKGKQQVKQCYQKAILVAQSQSAKLFELRAALDLAKSWYRQGRNDNVRDLLTPLTHWFCAETHLEDLEISRTLLSKLADR